MTSPTLLLTRALAFAAARHTGQKAKGTPERPFLEHLIEVAALVADATAGSDPRLVAAALLHDTLEKTETSREELVASFGPDVAAVVAEVSDDASLSETEQKAAQVRRAPALSPRAKMIRLADKVSNLWALSTEPEEKWPPAKRRAYLDWAAAVAEGCRGVSQKLDQAFDEAAAAFTGTSEISSQARGALTPRQRP